MEVGSIVFSKQYGFGRVIGMKDNFVITHFLKIGDKKILNTFLEQVDPQMVQYLLTESYKNDFKIKILDRALEYANDFAITNLFYHDKTIKAEIIGSYDYYTSAHFGTKGFTYTCNCPYEYGRCKHMAALCIYVRNIIEQLNSYQGETKTTPVELSAKIKADIDGYALRRGAVSETVYDIVKDIEDHLSVDYLQKFFRYLSNIATYKANFSNIFRGLGMNDKIREVLLNNLGSIKVFSFYGDLSRSIGLGSRVANEIHNGYVDSSDYNVDYYFFNHNFEAFINAALNQNSYYFRYDAYLPKAVSLVTMTPSLFNSLKRYLIEGKRWDSLLIEKLIAKLSLEQKAELYIDERINLRPSYQQIAEFPDDFKEKLISRVLISASDIPIILADLDHFKLSDQTTAKLLNCMKDVSYSEKYIPDIVALANALPDSHYLSMYLGCNTFTRRSHYGYSDEIYDLDYNNVLEDTGAMDRYFKAKYRINTRENGYIVSYMIDSLTDRNVFSAVVDNNDKYYVIQNDFDGFLKSPNVQKYINYIYQKNKEEIDKQLEQMKEEILIKLRQEQKKRLTDDINNIKYACSSTSIQLAASRKAKLEYNFRLDRDKASVNFRVGIDKFYVVKNIYSFLDNFKEGLTEKYGKNLVLTHKVKNFDSQDAEVLNQLLLFEFERDYYGDVKSLSLNGHLFNKIIHLLKGRNVFINDDAYKITLNKLEPEVFVDSDYILHYSLSDERYESIDYEGYLYVLDKQNHCLDIVECSNKEIMLYSLANRNNNSEIKDVVDVFKDEVYSRFSDKIVVAEELKRQFRLSVLAINAYFDYDSKKIIVRSEYLKNDQPVEKEHLTREDDKNRVALYNQYLESIGFVEDELKDDASVLAFFSMDLSDLKDYCNVYLSESIKNKQIVSFSPATIRIVYENNMMQAFMEQSDYSDEELDKILKGIRKNKKYVQLTGDRIIDLTDDSAKDFLHTVEDIGLDSKHLSDRSEVSVVKALKGYAHNERVSADSYLANMVDDIKNFKKSELEIPEINGELRNYQKDGYRWMKILSDYHVGGILADDMGLGKTIQVICLLKGDNTEQPSLIVCPKSLVFNWKNEFSRFSPDEKVIEIYGGKDERIAIINKMKADEKCIYITSYDSLRNDLDAYKVDFNYLIIDEAQYIKNVTALKTMSVKQLKAAHKFALTGTPIENNIIDLWSIFDFIMPGYLEDLGVFKSNYSNYEEFTELVRRRVAPFILRRTKSNVLKDLPEKFERVLSADMTVDQRKHYDAIAKQARELMAISKGTFDALQYLTRLRQVCVDPKTFIENYQGGSGKMDLLEETVRDYVNDGHRILIFSQYVKALNLVALRLKSNHIPYYMITGDTEGKERIDIADSFNNNSDEKVCLISLKAGGTGLNLIGADTVIILDPWWNVAAENQAIDRAVRIGQTKNVEVIRFICSNSIEQRVIELQNIKKDLIDRLIANDESSIHSISLEDIRFILD